MSNFTLKQDGFTSHTSISNCFIEQFMPYAAGEFVKIYIYLLKCVGENRSELSISRIADVFNNTEKDVVRALKYWQKKGLLKLSFDDENTLTSLCIVSLSDVDPVQEPEHQKVKLNVVDAPVPGQPHNNIKHSRKEYTQTEIMSFAGQDDVGEMLYVIQMYLGRTLTGKDTNTILYFYDQLGFPADLIEYLFEYCVSKGKNNLRYIEKTGIAWAEEGIKTVNAAKMKAGIYSDKCYNVLNAFGLRGRVPTKSETEYVSRWVMSYGFSMDVILMACNRTMDQLHQPNFEYADAILKNWKSNGVTSTDDVKKLDENFIRSAEKKKAAKRSSNAVAAGSRFNNFNQRDYDFSILEKQLMNK